MSVSAATIRFPPPPPTRNQLTTEERTKLIRTNNKLGQVLGTTPHVLDLYSLPPRARREAELAPPKTPTSMSMRNPFRTHSRTKSVPKVDMVALRANSPDSVSSTSSTASRKSASSTSSARPLVQNEQSWRSPYPAQRRPPLLKLSTPGSARRPSLETIPGSPPFDQLATTIDPPAFTIPSDAAARREKMRRLRRRLGENVPANLVFPSYPEESDSEEDSPLISTPTESSIMSREWLLVHKPLPDEPAVASNACQPFSIEPDLERPLPETPPAKESASTRRRLLKERERPKTKPSKGAQRLESIAESSAEAHRGEKITCVGISASTGMQGMGKTRRFVKGDIAIDQIGGAWTWGIGIGI